jgi:hypothetical protein
MNKKPIISRYVTTGLQAFVNLFTTKAEREQRKAKMGLKLHSGASEIVLNNFSNTNVCEDKKSYTSPKQQEQLRQRQSPKFPEQSVFHSASLCFREFRDIDYLSN